MVVQWGCIGSKCCGFMLVKRLAQLFLPIISISLCVLPLFSFAMQVGVTQHTLMPRYQNDAPVSFYIGQNIPSLFVKKSLFPFRFVTKLKQPSLRLLWQSSSRSQKLSIRSLRRLKRAIEKGIPLRLLDVRGSLKKPTVNFNPVWFYQLLHGISHVNISASTGSKVPLLDNYINSSGDLSNNENSPEQQGVPSVVIDTMKEMMEVIHPVLQVLYKRKAEGSKPRNRTDSYRVALSIEGGAMRGCISAGMVVALNYLGFTDCFDSIYGSSAGSLVGAYLISRQLPYEGCQIYYKWLPAAGRKFINVLRMGRCIGLGPLLDGDLKNFLFDRLGKPSLNLDILLDDIVTKKQPLNWTSFWKWNQIQPLKIIASGLLSEKGIILDSAHGNFETRSQLLDCIRASMLLPGIAGPVVYLRTPGTSVRRINASIFEDNKGYAIPRFQKPTTDWTGEPMADAMLYEPIPYRSALQENSTNDRIPFKNAQNENGYLYAMAIPSEGIEISRSDLNRKVLYEGIRAGFACAFDILIEDPNLRGTGADVAKQSSNCIEKKFVARMTASVHKDRWSMYMFLYGQVFPDKNLNEVLRFKWVNSETSTPLPPHSEDSVHPHFKATVKTFKELLRYANTTILKHT
ncbi:phospholipase, patatin family protein [Cardiosporidium cionae]|uniref:Phospholipase, patatin family protein n=1 Tax=Cardiosporidium cionae TaxID=476202 RepID=A0ABQ7J6P3_9APIC|nr:phospholipase, patatin family protein [Cardiosporidium cionae]|eukprot:KAF8819654.1 phospholipase, patatin family protein [Cardiosporidium cionae]